MALFASHQFIISRKPAEVRARELVGNLSVTQSGDATNILALTYETENPRIGVDIVNQFMEEYQLAGLDDKRQQAVNALKFIDDQQKLVSKELGEPSKSCRITRRRTRYLIRLSNRRCI
jgi:uncharacterized protein involved in exopolysaccharide biosynthesis